MRIKSVGHAVFAVTFIGLGILGLIQHDFTVVWHPVAKGLPAREVLVYLCAIICLASGLGLLWRRTAAAAAGVLLGALLPWLLLMRLPALFLAPSVGTSWPSGETAVMLAGAWILCVWFATDREQHGLAFATGENGLRIARVL